MRIQKKITIGIVGAIMVTALAIGSANAGAWCHNGTVVLTGIFPDLENANRSKYAITINCPAGQGDWTGDLRFFLIPGLGKSGYATALTAMTTGQPVETRSYDANANALMERINLLPAP